MDYAYLAMIFISIILIALYFIVIVYYLNSFIEQRKNVKLAIGISIIINIISVIVQRIYYIPTYITYFLLIPVIVVEIYMIFKVTFLQALYCSFMSQFYLYGFSEIILCLTSLFSGYSIIDLIVNRPFYAQVFTVSRIICIIFFLLIKYSVTPGNIRQKYSYGKIQVLQVIASQFILSILLLSVTLAYKLEFNPLIYFAIFVLIMLSDFFYRRVCFQNVIKLAQMEDVQLYASDLESQLIKQKEHYTNFREEIEKFKKFDHDYQGMIRILDKLLNSNEYQDKQELVSQFAGEMNKKTNKYSNNIVIDALLSDAHKFCNEHDISFKAKVFINEKSKIRDIDLIRMYNNLLKNAIEANLKIRNNNERFIDVSCRVSENWIIVIVKNAYNGERILEDDKFTTTKRNKSKHGYGLKIVKEIVEDNDGMLSIEPDQTRKVFTVKVFKRYQKNQKDYLEN